MTAPAARPEALLDDVYGAIAAPSRWPDALDGVRAALDGRIAVLGVIDHASASRISVVSGDPELIAPLLTRYAQEVPFFSAAPVLEIDRAYTVDAMYAVQGPGARGHWLESPIVTEWVAPNRLDDFFWLSMTSAPGRNGALVVVTGVERRPITGYDIAWIEALSPHLRRAVEIADLFEVERERTILFQRLIEALSNPVLVVARDMRVLYANAAAITILDGAEVVAQRSGRAAFVMPHADKAIARAVDLGVRDEFQLGSAGIGVPLSLGARPAIVHVLPLARREPEARIVGGAAAALFFGVAGTKPPPAMDAVASLFGLTAAEKRVAALVAEGLSRKDIAAAQGLSDGTIKTQLAAIFDKTGVHDQRQLELLIRELSPPVK